ncbi:hypothetical protein D3C86_2011140 [compost metagenome]
MLPGGNASVAVAFELQGNDRGSRFFIVAEKLNGITRAITLPGAGELVGIAGVAHFKMTVGPEFQF